MNVIKTLICRIPFSQRYEQVCKTISTLQRYSRHNSTTSRPKTGHPKGTPGGKLEVNILKTLKIEKGSCQYVMYEKVTGHIKVW